MRVKHTMFALMLLVAACKSSDSTTSSKSAEAPETVPAKPETKPEKARPAPEAPKPDPAYVSKDGRYTQKVTFGDAIEKTLDDPNGGTWHTAKWNTPGGLFMVQYADYADHATAKAETMGFVPTRDESAIKKDEAIKVGAREGRAVEWAMNATVMMYARFIIEDKRVYKLAVGTKGSREEAEKFFGGFEITAAK